MPICLQCQAIDPDELSSKPGLKLHESWAALEIHAQECDLSRLIRSQLLGYVVNDYHGHVDQLLTHTTNSSDYARLKVRHEDEPLAGEEWQVDRDTSVWIKLDGGSFESWIGKLVFGLPGSCQWVWRNDKLEFSSMALSVGIRSFAHPENPILERFPKVLKRRPIAPTPLHHDAIAWVRAALQGCRDKHPACKNLQMRIDGPRRLLDLRNVQNKGELDIVEMSGKLCPKYLTLSYCWGPADKLWMSYLYVVQTESFTFQFNRMPSTLRDAVTITQMLGYEYLWIDALCILQHDHNDWLEEGARMGSIYEGCELMISASNCNQSNDSFLRQRMHLEEYALALPLQVNHSKIGILCLVSHDTSYGQDAVLGPLANRAWCLQEQRLAPRVLHFGVAQCHYECKAGIWEESAVKLDFSPRPYGAKNLRRPHDKTGSQEEFHDYKPSALITRVYEWNTIVWDYSMRKLTKSSDKLIAISGLAQKAWEQLRCQYLAGVWLKDLHLGLCWHASPISRVVYSAKQTDASYMLVQEAPKRASTYRAPSWSWASIDGPVTFIEDGDSRYGLSTTSSMECIDSSVELSTDNAFGAVKAAHITLRVPLRVVPSDQLAANVWMEYYEFYTVKNKIGFYLEDAQNYLVGDITCIRIATCAQGIGPSLPTQSIVLLLEQCDGGKYRRVGIGVILVEEYFDNAPLQVVTLV